MAAVTMVNAVVGEGNLKVNWTNIGNKSSSQYFSQISTTVGYGANNTYSVLANRTMPMTVVATADTVNPVFTGVFNFAQGSIYSFFLSGKVGSIDTTFLKESIPAFGDSSCGVRIINLIYNGNPITGRLAGNATMDFPSVGYKQSSQFKQYASLSSNSSYTFEIVDYVTNSVLGTYKVSTPFFHNVTLALIGQMGGVGSSAPKIVQINHY